MPIRNSKFVTRNCLPIEAEQTLAAPNRELIARFEKKIQATLARIWGEEQKSALAGRRETGITKRQKPRSHKEH